MQVSLGLINLSTLKVLSYVILSICDELFLMRDPIYLSLANDGRHLPNQSPFPFFNNYNKMRIVYYAIFFYFPKSIYLLIICNSDRNKTSVLMPLMSMKKERDILEVTVCISCCGRTLPIEFRDLIIT